MLIAGGEVTVNPLVIRNPAIQNWLKPNPEAQLVLPDIFRAVYIAASRADKQGKKTGEALLAGSAAVRTGWRCWNSRQETLSKPVNGGERKTLRFRTCTIHCSRLD
jgi:hypothetical protein